MSDDMEVFASATTIKLPAAAQRVIFPSEYQLLYSQLISRALREFPPVEGYETTHSLLIERMAYFFVKQKVDENEPVQTFDLKKYKVNVSAFLRTVEALLKEARSISAEVAFKHNFVRQVVEVLDRSIGDVTLKRTVITELHRLASQ